MSPRRGMRKTGAYSRGSGTGSSQTGDTGDPSWSRGENGAPCLLHTSGKSKRPPFLLAVRGQPFVRHELPRNDPGGIILKQKPGELVAVFAPHRRERLVKPRVPVNRIVRIARYHMNHSHR